MQEDRSRNLLDELERLRAAALRGELVGLYYGALFNDGQVEADIVGEARNSKATMNLLHKAAGNEIDRLDRAAWRPSLVIA